MVSRCGRVSGSDARWFVTSGSRFATYPIFSKVRTAAGAFWLQVVVQVRGGSRWRRLDARCRCNGGVAVLFPVCGAAMEARRMVTVAAAEMV